MNFITFVTETSLGFVLVATPIVLAFIQGIKATVNFDSRWAFPLSLGLGIVAGIFFGAFNSISYNVLSGILVGLSASGLYAGVKKVVTDK